MTISNVRTLVDEERQSLLEGNEGIEEAVATLPPRGQTIAIGLLALDEVAAAKRWFRALPDEWVRYADMKWEGSYQGDSRQSAQLGPWDYYIDGIYAAILGQTALDEIAAVTYDRATASFVDDLDHRKLAHRIDLIRALSSHLSGNDEVDVHVATLEANVRDRDKPWTVDRYLPYARLLRGLDAGDESAVSAGLDGLVEFHRDRVASARDADAVQQAVATDATAMLALARRKGVPVTVDHELIPDALNDPEHYPAGE